MNLVLSFEDSEIDHVEQSAHGLSIFLAAASVNKLPTSPSESAVQGFARAVRLDLFGVAYTGSTSELFGRIAAGHIAVGNDRLLRVPLPSRLQGPLVIDLSLANRTPLSLPADGFECTFAGEENFAETLFC